jgi:hypothetical protein
MIGDVVRQNGWSIYGNQNFVIFDFVQIYANLNLIFWRNYSRDTGCFTAQKNRGKYKCQEYFFHLWYYFLSKLSDLENQGLLQGGLDLKSQKQETKKLPWLQEFYY